MSVENQRARASLGENEEHYRAVAEAATDAIITIDSDSTILVVKSCHGKDLRLLQRRVDRPARTHSSGLLQNWADSKGAKTPFDQHRADGRARQRQGMGAAGKDDFVCRRR